MALRDYLQGEVAQDYADGLLTRREAVRRLGLMGVERGAARRPAGGVRCPDEAGPPPGSTVAAAGSRSRRRSTVPGGRHPPGQPVRFAGPAGELQGAWAAPADPQGAVLVIHENRGLTPHFFDLVGRLAGAGYAALSVDLLSRRGRDGGARRSRGGAGRALRGAPRAAAGRRAGRARRAGPPGAGREAGHGRVLLRWRDGLVAAQRRASRGWRRRRRCTARARPGRLLPVEGRGAGRVRREGRPGQRRPRPGRGGAGRGGRALRGADGSRVPSTPSSTTPASATTPPAPPWRGASCSTGSASTSAGYPAVPKSPRPAGYGYVHRTQRQGGPVRHPMLRDTPAFARRPTVGVALTMVVSGCGGTRAATSRRRRPRPPRRRPPHRSATLDTVSYVTEARQARAEGRSPWFCTSQGLGGSMDHGHQDGLANDVYAGKTKGTLSPEDCDKVAAMFDDVIAKVKPYRTRGDLKKSGGFVQSVQFVPGLGTHDVARGGRGGFSTGPGEPPSVPDVPPVRRRRRRRPARRAQLADVQRQRPAAGLPRRQRLVAHPHDPLLQGRRQRHRQRDQRRGVHRSWAA